MDEPRQKQPCPAEEPAARQADELTKYATIMRYPGGIRPVSESEYQEATAIAVVQWADERL